MASERAVLAGGCFWGMQDLIRKMRGVVSTRVGYSGGDVPNATYRNHGSHAEAIEIVFDPAVMSYRRLLEFFFQIHDPTTPNRQGNDRGASYRSAIYYASEAQRLEALDTIKDVEASGLWPGRWSRKSRPWASSGRRKRNIRTIWSATLGATPVTSRGRTGSCLGAQWPEGCRQTGHRRLVQGRPVAWTSVGSPAFICVPPAARWSLGRRNTELGR